MAKFSVSGEDDGEGPSNPTPKRRRIAISYFTDGEDDREDIGNPSGTEGEGDVSAQESQLVQREEHVADDQDPVAENSDDFFWFRPISNNNSGENDVSATENRDRSISVMLTDPDVLDCCICYEPLSIPIFQCENGHIACSFCCIKLMNKCPMCFMPIGYNRCRAIEKVLESVKVSCLNAKYGCKETVCYSKKNDHEKECIHAPCTCPHSGCDFVASSKELTRHFKRKHEGSAIHFTYGHFFSVFLKVADKVVFLQEQNGAELFILHSNVESLGNIVNISCIGPSSLKTVYHYDILARSQGCCLKLKSFAKNTQDLNAIDTTTSTGFLLIPCGFFNSSGRLKLEICIRCNVVTDLANVQ
ncbi:E3 ubiquitin-protein ligase SINA-like 10 [Senna tora]|uniref:RING-type E3 ubiquitin transferase n=1 Tax=Senna tora TaxID=362788 RepID=A0A834XBG5_9FABA|nr:E3 ubiquitin-protein ligase SINA-like 10 [Senna tora]